jgi:MFS family permease
LLYRSLDPRRTLQALQHVFFRWWLVERMVGAETWAMRGVARGWLVYNLTGSVLALAWVEAVRALVNILVSPLAGVISDRVEKRLIMESCRFALVFTNLAFAAVIFAGSLQMWHIVAVTIAEALIYSIMEPSLQSIMTDLVDRDLLLSATSTTFVVEGVLNIIGAAAAGIVIETAGAGWVFLVNAPLFALASFALHQMPKTSVGSNSTGSLRADLAAGARYLRSSPILILLLVLAFARLIFIQPYSSFLPAFAKGLGFDAEGLGLLVSAGGLGALASSLLIASIGDPRNKGKLVLASGAAAAFCVVVLMGTGKLLSPFLFVILAGLFSNAADILTRTLMQLTCDANYRGRVTSVTMITGGLVTLSVIPAGVLSDTYGVPLVVGGLAALVLVIHVAATVVLPSIRKLS